ncbi:MAG: hypothetical protein ACRD2W_23680 [Acidimicrobiales bacterium]
MSAGTAHTNKVALGLAVGTSAALGAAAVTGHGLTVPEVVGAFGVAGVIGVLNVRSNFPRQPHSLTPVPEVEGAVVINAARARSMAAHPASQSVAAGHSRSDAA